ncbi:DUF6550 family protein [Caproiciproducens sp. CPB-2]|uniref:DUF6550 family protein n=1 Tax=Caproiciproducens sp. CPB-2 TaxID=3030017 RepID=UPI0023DB1A58|nr:DUF6550 family protein [Caproiciproducens sp. CPB-2]MDF1494988.1 hypothetical protein [Caproiciproducens sp. CPB-2]
MKKKIILVVAIITCVALCTAVWPWSFEVGDLPIEPIKPAVIAEIEARAEETPQIFLSADIPAPEQEAVAESEPQKTDITAEKEIQKPAPTQQTQTHKLSPSSSEPHMGDVRVVNSEKQTYIDGFGWIEDHSSEGGGTTVGNPGDELTGNKVGQMGGTTGDGKGDINKQVVRHGRRRILDAERNNPSARRTAGTDRRCHIHRDDANTHKGQHPAAI